jgi:hypothetical protein
MELTLNYRVHKIQLLVRNLSQMNPVFIFFPVALQPSNVSEVSKPYFSTFVRTPWARVSPSQGLYRHRTAQHRITRMNIHALSGIRTHDPSIQTAKNHAPDRGATEIGRSIQYTP